MTAQYHIYKEDFPKKPDLGDVVAIDCETMGLNLIRDRLCVVQLSGGDGRVHIIQISPKQKSAPHLVRLLEDPQILKLFHFGRFDIAALYHKFGALARPVYCTKIASKIARTYTDAHGLKSLVQELLGIELSKQQQTSDWGAKELNQAQIKYAGADVLYLHDLRKKLDIRLHREGRFERAKACFSFLPERAILDVEGWADNDIFAH